MRNRYLLNILQISLSVLIVLGVLSSCSDDEKATHGSGMRITVHQEVFGAVTRAASTGVMHQESFDLGDGIFMDVTLQEDFADEAQPVATRSGLSDGTYTILGYYTDGRFAGSNVGTVSGSMFTPTDDFKFHDGTYDFICVSNVELTPNNDAAIVQRGQAKDRVALISDKVRGEIKGEDVELTFTMRHKESGIRFNIKSPGMFDEVNITIAAPGEKPLQHEYALPAVTFNDKTVQSSAVEDVEFTINGGSQYTDYQYFLPGTDAQDISITFNSGKVWGKELKGETVTLTSLTEPLKANTRYTATINFRDGLPAFDGIIAIGSDGKLTVTAVTDNDLAARTVFFKGGSVIAHGSRRANWKNAEGVNQVVFNPSGIESFANWTDVPNGPTQGITAEYHNVAGNIAAGHGDPCRLVGLTVDEIKSGSKIDNKLWRLPTREEYEKSNAGERWIAATDASDANRMGMVI